LSYQTGDAIKPLIVEAIKQTLGRSTPRQLSRQLMPRRMMLDAIHLREHEPTRRDRDGHSPVLESVATLLSGKRRGQRAVRAIARDREVRLLVEQLTQSRANLLLLGDSGCGKSTVLAEAIRQLRRVKAKSEQQAAQVSDEDPSRRHFWRTSGQRLIAGMRYLGQWEERCELVIGELADTGSVLCMENLLELVRVGGCEPSGSVAAFFQPYLQRGELRMVAEATSAELDACRRLLPGFADLFQIVRIPEFSPVEARQVLDRLMTEGASHRKLHVEQGTADLIYRLYRRFQPYAAFPGRSAAFVRHLLERTPAREAQTNGAIDSAVVLSAFQRETGLPERLLRDDMTLAHEQVLDDFRSAVLGQEAACQAAAGVVTTLKTGLNDPLRPLGVLLFCGPTGVGKTEMAKALARYLFGGSGATDRLLRLDMSEYAGPGAAHRLMLSADGGPSEFIKQARRQPFSVVLLDEIEKAASEIHDALLGVLDEGRLTDRYGRVTTFRSAVIVMTSNLGAERSDAIGFDANVRPSFERTVLEHFRPEFVNRIDRIVTFEPLGRDTIAELVVRELRSLAHREGIAKRNLTLHWTPDVVDFLANAGFDARYGARPLHRALEQFVVAPFSRWLLEHAHVRDAAVSITVADTGIRFDTR
jgi:ATP-dependent Clp protease ATP-binding subunit ClpC